MAQQRTDHGRRERDEALLWAISAWRNEKMLAALRRRAARRGTDRR
jgi:hypothetical protein